MARMFYQEYKRRVFNKALLECITKVHHAALNSNDRDELDGMSARLCETFFNDELKLTNSTIAQTKARLSEAAQYVQDAVLTAEHIAEDKAECAEKDCMEIAEDQSIELSDEDEAVIQQLFDVKAPTPQIEAIRDATVTALIAEDKKAQEVKEAIDIANSQVTAGESPAKLEETVNRINRQGPTSLMNAIINNITGSAIRDVSNNNNFVSVSKVMHENADEIKTRAAAVYALYETASQLGIHKYTQAEIRKLSYDIFADN